MKIGLQSWGGIVPSGRRRGIAALALTAVLAAGALATAQAQTYKVLYSFQCPASGSYPVAGLVADKAGNVYGTTEEGGTGPCSGLTTGCGTVFKLDTNGTETVLHSFDISDGYFPLLGSLVLDGAGNMYGTTSHGGSNGADAGLVFRLTPAGTETVLYSFLNGFDGADPSSGLVRDSAGNLYGTTSSGGGYGSGVVFKIAPGGRESILHDFDDIPTDGASPNDGLVLDSAGNLYGTTTAGGPHNAGTIFQVTPSGTETVLYSFLGPPTDGANPSGTKLLRDAAGNLYGATQGGGAYSAGVVFKLSATGTESVLLNFLGGKEGLNPLDGLAEDTAGNLYGTTINGGSSGYGVLFKLTTTGKEFVLHNFAGPPADGASPNGGLIRDSRGNLYGSTFQGGTYSCGTVFKMAP